jgi:hypothetical protein
MTTPPSISLAVFKQSSLLDGLTLFEYYPKERVKALIISDYLRIDWIPNRYGVIKNYENEKQQLETFLKNYDKKTNAFKVEYRKPKHGWGRVLVSNALGSTAFSKKVRNTLIQGLFADFDLKNAQPEIIRNICNANNIPCPNIERYCNHRNDILNLVMTSYNVDKGDAKKLFLRLCFFGTFQGWSQELNISEPIIPFISDFQNELIRIANCIKVANPLLFETARKLKESKQEKNYVGSMFALYLQEYEERIVQKVAMHLINNTELMNHPNKNCKAKVGIYEYDGIKLLIEQVNKFGGNQAVMKYLNEITYDLINFKLEWEEKPIESFYDISKQLELVEVEKCNQNETKMTDGVWDDKQATETLFKLYPHWVFCKETLYAFDMETGLWDSDHTSHLKIIQQFSDNLHVIRKVKDEIVVTEHSYGNTLSLMEKIPVLIKTLCRNENWLKQKQSSSLGKILFENGYYDFKAQKFYDKSIYGFNPEILFMGRIHHQFSDFNLTYIDSIKQRLFYDTLGKEVGDYLILNLARGLAGDMMKRILFGLGGTNSGKTILTSAVTLSCGDYVGGFNAENLAYRNSSNDEAQIMRWALLLRFKRLIFSNEMKSTVELNGNMMKKLASGGDTLIGRNHCKAEEEFVMQCLAICFANDVPKIKPYDDAVDGRLRVVSFKKSYVKEPTNELELLADPNLQFEIKTLEFQQAFVGLLIQYYTFHNNESEPIEVISAKKEWVNEDKNVIETFKNDFEITNNETDFTVSNIIETWINDKKLGITMKKFGMEMKKYAVINKLEKVDNKVKKINGKGLQVWFGIKKIEEVFDDDN